MVRILCLLTALTLPFGPAHAADANDLLEVFKQMKVTFKYVKGDDENTAITGQPHIWYSGPGQLAYSRTDQVEGSRSYLIKFSQVSAPTIPIDLEIKSSTCMKMKLKTACRARMTVPLIEFDLIPLPGTPPAKKTFRALSPFEVPDQISRKYFPEVANLFKLEMSCNDWSWAGFDSKGGTFLEAGFSTDRRIKDLGRDVQSPATIGKNIKCDLKNGGCALKFGDEGTGMSMTYVTVFGSDGFSLETADENGSCTTAFRNASVVTAEEYVTGRKKTKPIAEFSKPAYLARMQGLLDENFIADYQHFVAVNEMSNLFGNEPQVDKLAFAAKQPWMSVFGLANASNYSPGGECYQDRKKCDLTISLEDNLNGEAR